MTKCENKDVIVMNSSSVSSGTERTLANVAKAMFDSEPGNKKISIRVVKEKTDGSIEKQWGGCNNRGGTWLFTK